MYRLRRLRARLPRVGHLRPRRPAGEVEELHRAQRQVLRPIAAPVYRDLKRMPAQRRVQQSTSMRMHFSAIPADFAIFAVKDFFIRRCPNSDSATNNAPFNLRTPPLQSKINLSSCDGAEGVGGDRSAHVSPA